MSEVGDCQVGPCAQPNATDDDYDYVDTLLRSRSTFFTVLLPIVLGLCISICFVLPIMALRLIKKIWKPRRLVGVSRLGSSLPSSSTPRSSPRREEVNTISQQNNGLPSYRQVMASIKSGEEPPPYYQITSESEENGSSDARLLRNNETIHQAFQNGIRPIQQNSRDLSGTVDMQDSQALNSSSSIDSWIVSSVYLEEPTWVIVQDLDSMDVAASNFSHQNNVETEQEPQDAIRSSQQTSSNVGGVTSLDMQDLQSPNSNSSTGSWMVNSVHSDEPTSVMIPSLDSAEIASSNRSNNNNHEEERRRDNIQSIVSELTDLMMFSDF